MNQLKNKLLMVIALSGMTLNLMPHGGGGGGFGAGLAGGMLGGMVVSGAMSNRGNSDRGPEYYQYKEERSRQARIDSFNKRLGRLESNLDKAKTAEQKTRIQRQIDRINKELDTL